MYKLPLELRGFFPFFFFKEKLTSLYLVSFKEYFPYSFNSKLEKSDSLVFKRRLHLAVTSVSQWKHREFPSTSGAKHTLEDAPASEQLLLIYDRFYTGN